MKNIYYITDIILDKRSVHTIHVTEICANLAALGCGVTLYAPSTSKFQSPKEYRIKFISTPPWVISVFYQLHLFLRLCYDLSVKRPDGIYSRSSQLLFVPVLMSKLFRIPIVLEINGKLIEESRRIGKGMLIHVLLALRILHIIEYFNVKFASQLITTTQGLKEHLIETYYVNPDKITVISSGVDIGFFKPQLPSISRNELNLTKDAFYVGYIGSLLPWQGLRYVVATAHLMSAKRPNVKFLIVGDGSDVAYLTSFISKEKLEGVVELRPAVSHDIIPLYINAMDVCLSYPHKSRGGTTSPFKVYEYLACAKPVVSSDIVGMREEFGDILVYSEPESPKALEIILLSLLDNEQRRLELGQAGRKFVEQGHSWQAIAKQTLIVLEKATK